MVVVETREKERTGHDAVAEGGDEAREEEGGSDRDAARHDGLRKRKEAVRRPADEGDWGARRDWLRELDI